MYGFKTGFLGGGAGNLVFNRFTGPGQGRAAERLLPPAGRRDRRRRRVRRPQGGGGGGLLGGIVGGLLDN